MLLPRLPFAALASLLLALPVWADEPTKQQLDFFENKIRPVLVEKCYQCHSAQAAAAKKLKGALALDTREATRRGGESGPAVVPGKTGESLLVAALRHESFEMPPSGKLPDEVIADFVRWIEMGAADPRDGGGTTAAAGIDLAEGRKHWSFAPLADAAPPAVEDAAWIRNGVDQFIRARQEAEGVTPNPAAAPRTVIRRVYFDALGLPPAPERVEAFVEAARQDFDAAYSELLEEVLASEHFGERWGRHWLDLARFAESNGYAFDKDRPNAFHYRDFVIRALNEDMPYDRFVRLQLAGDLLAKLNVENNADVPDAIRHLAATGFLVAGPFTTQQTQKERERSRYEQLDDIINTTGTALLGLTVGCCRCHDHKYDPLPINDYYRLASCFRDVGFADVAINNQPEQFQAAKQAYDQAHAPLAAARAKYEQESLPAKLQAWIDKRSERAGKQAAAAQAPQSVKLTAWRHAGPFPAASLAAAFAEAFPPEKAVDLAASYRDGAVKWVEHKDWADGTVHNTLTGDNTAHYLYREIDSPAEQSLALSLGSDDAIKVWVNGKQLLANEVSRGAAADQEQVQAPLAKGRNQLLVKIVNGAGPSGFYFSAKPAAAAAQLAGVGPWRHIGPFTAKDLNAAFAEAFPPESNTDAAATYEDGKLKWVEQPQWLDGEPHNDKLTGNNCANYLYREIVCDAPRAAALSLGSDDGIKLWLNGRELLAKKVGRNTAAAGQEKLTIQLAEGRNELLIKIVNGGGKTGFYFAATAGSPPKPVADVLAVTPDKWNDKQQKQVLDWFKGYDRQWLQVNDAATEHEKQAPKPSQTSIYAAKVRGTTYQFGANTYKVFHLRRGNADNKGDEAQPGFLRVLMDQEQRQHEWLGDGESVVDPRLALAEWLTDVEHGSGALLARVIVNRLWHHHFGRGLVATPSDFGARGERPSHPLLLDYLAAELIREGWRLKPIHRLMMSSSAYLQGGAAAGKSAEIDPENLLLWRRQSRRLEAEVVRDTLLSVSGKLDTKMFGKGTLDAKAPRRSVYLTVKRSNLIPMLQLFDWPDAMQSVGARQESTVAPQALAMLNSPFVRQRATELAARVRPDAKTTLEGAVHAAYQLAVSRPATESDLQRARQFVARQTEIRGGQGNAEQLALRDFCHLLLCTNEFLFVD